MRRVVLGIVLALVVTSAVGGPARAEVDPENPAHHVVLVPESARPVWTWLKRVTRPNDPFVGTRSRYFFARASTRVTPRSDTFPARTETNVWPGPAYATHFRFTVGSDRWAVAADPRHHLVLYGEACCSFGRKVLTAYAGALPRGVARHDLSGVVPASGIRIGDTAAAVFRALGSPVKRLTAPGSTRWAAAYSRPMDDRRRYMPNTTSCVEERTAVFEHDRLVAYEIYSGC